MIETNLLLALGFSIVASFSNVVQVPRELVPAVADDLSTYSVDTFYSPPALYLLTRAGARFSIRDGVVCRYSAREYYQRKKKTGWSDSPAADGEMTSTRALQTAASILRQLLKDGKENANPLRELIVRRGNADGDDCYRVAWVRTNSVNRYEAAIELDRRSGGISLVELFAKEFFDYDAALQISNKVYVADPVSEVHVSNIVEQLSPKPGVTTNMVAEAIPSWLWLCRRLGVPPGPQTNIDWVEWQETFVYTNDDISAIRPVLQVRFKNKTCFESCGGIAFSHFASDACFTGFWSKQPPEYFRPFEGRVFVRWEDSSTNLDRVLTEQLGVSPELLAQFSPSGKWKPPEVGAQTVKRLVVNWRHWPKSEGFVPVEESTLAFAVEFDLGSGELKWISFHDPAFIDAIARRQDKSGEHLSHTR